VALLDLILLYDCNLGCDYCTITPEMRSKSLSTEAVLREMRRGREEGYDALSLTGGEPTLRKDLLSLLRAARGLGFGTIKLQTNGLLLAHAPNLDRLVAAGANLFHVSIHTHLEPEYDRMVRQKGAFPLMAAALGNLTAREVRLRADLIVTRQTYPRLPDAVRWLAEKRVRALDLWYVSLTDGNAQNVGSLPRMSEAVPAMREALAIARAEGIEARSLHVPRCLLGPDAVHAYDPGSDRVKVVTPDASFELDRSKLAGRVHVPACERGCAHRAICPGVRADYLARFGADEIAPVPPVGGAPVHGGSGTSSSS
jgi:MoaA/NifB/PqqE/SkfB family radical SAM enzyme